MEIARLFNAGTGEGRLPRLAQILVALELQLSARQCYFQDRAALDLCAPIPSAVFAVKAASILAPHEKQ